MKNGLFISEKIRNKILELTDSENGPFYLYDVNKIKHNCQQFLDIPYEPKSIHFAMMANSNPHFLEIIRQAGLKIFVNSILHLETAIDQGFVGEEIVFAASAMDEATMRTVKSCGAKLVLDSTGQINLWQSLFPETGIGIRCNIGDLMVPQKTTGGYFIGKESRLGLTLGSINTLKGNPNIKGLHIYIGTNISETAYFLESYRHVTKLAALFPNLEYLDFGGGFGFGEKIKTVFDLKDYGQKVTALMEEVSAKFGREIKLILEPGRIIGIDSGYFACRVVDIKMRNNQQLIGVNASCAQFPRPLFYPDSAFHPVSVVSSKGYPLSKTVKLSSIFGCSTYSRDFLARDIKLPQTHPGDIVILGDAGSYCASAYTSFLGFPKAKEYFV